MERKALLELELQGLLLELVLLVLLDLMERKALLELQGLLLELVLLVLLVESLEMEGIDHS
jgi:hypothetical protein